MYLNGYLCFDDTIDWRDLLSGEGAEVVADRQRLRTCESCYVFLSPDASVTDHQLLLY